MKIHLFLCALLSSWFVCQNAFAEVDKPLNQEQLDRSLRLDFWYGGWEADYTKKAYELMASYRGVDNLHLLGGFGKANNVYYDRSKVYAGAYYFYEEYSYIKTLVSLKKYDYPINPATLTINPDSSSYHREPKLELELSRSLTDRLRGNFSYEISHPNFFHDQDTSITNHKLGAELIFVTANPELHAKLYASMLHDPDPNTTEIKGRDNLLTPLGVAAATSVNYQNSTLFGGAADYVKEKWELEIKFLENRDLDNSYDYSLLNKFIFRLDDKSHVRLDYLHDKFSSQSNYAGRTANVYMISYYRELSQELKFGFGLKHIGLPNQSNDTAFIFLQAKTGVEFQ